jgi:hypothetical protein
VPFTCDQSFFFPKKVCHYLTKFGLKNCISSVDSTNYDILKEKTQYTYSSHEIGKDNPACDMHMHKHF